MHTKPESLLRVLFTMLVVLSNLFSVSGRAGASALHEPFTSCAEITQISQTECEALVALYNSTDGPNWGDHTGWLETNEPCHWYGLYCEVGLLTEINLNSNILIGTIPPEIGNLTNLKYLFLENNGLTGTIPVEIANLKQLEAINWGMNELSGVIPSEITGLSHLSWIGLKQNQLTGSIPAGIGKLTLLQGLDLGENQLEGKIPAEIGKLIKLELLDLNTNHFSGRIPEEIGNLTSLLRLDLSENQLEGKIPNEIGNLSQLEYLYLNSNDLKGKIPNEIGNLTHLRWLEMVQNHLNGNIPAEIGNLTQLNALYLSANLLSGNLPAEIGNLTQMEELYLSGNLLSGNLPAEIGNLTKLRNLFLDNNLLFGEIPVTITNMTNLGFFSFDCTITSTDPVVIDFMIEKFPLDWNACHETAQNTGFESYQGDKKIPSNWVAGQFSALDGKDTLVKRQGAASVKIKGQAGATKTLQQIIQMKMMGRTGDKFLLSFFIRGAGIPTEGVCRVQVLFYKDATAVGGKTYNCPTNSFEWKKINIQLAAPGTYTKIAIKLVYSKPSGTAWFDQVSLNK